MSLSALIVMDELADRSVVESSLRAKPIVFERCFAACATSTAHRWLEHEQVDLVFVDLDLEGGSQMVRDLRTNSRYGALPVVGMSYNSDAELVGQLLNGGLDAFLSKPLRRDIVRAEIEEIAGLRSGQSV
ncbi:response regulator [uncultured Paludibaculum sp.]|uniref:response regulator n=1 Tax=uncultured Paludibaculum sp. TaxID=1765020 RepID=UPI002AAB7F2A|nr:response regulator [uncultured Paludibaculum sp.]